MRKGMSMRKIVFLTTCRQNLCSFMLINLKLICLMRNFYAYNFAAIRKICIFVA